MYVQDICDIVEALMAPYPAPPKHQVYNMGGPQRLSRLDMAEAVADHRGYDKAGIQTSKSADVQRCVWVGGCCVWWVVWLLAMESVPCTDSKAPHNVSASCCVIGNTLHC